jgi:hypothetical protein
MLGRFVHYLGIQVLEFILELVYQEIILGIESALNLFQGLLVILAVL